MNMILTHASESWDSTFCRGRHTREICFLAKALQTRLADSKSCHAFVPNRASPEGALHLSVGKRAAALSICSI